jgi:uncharacterized repeat protein (TIGR02543 family)
MKSRETLTGKFLRFGVLVTLIFTAAISTSMATPASALPTIHTVTFAENDSGSDSVVSFETGSSTQDLTLFADLSPSFSNPGHAFAGWNTADDGSGTSYSDGASYSFASDIELYAQWTALPSIHTVTFAENDSDTDIVVSSQVASSPQDLTLFADLSPSFSNPGHTFAGWNTSEDGSGTSYSDGASYSFTADVELYAQWAVSTATATFADNGGIGAIEPVDVLAGSSVTLPGGSGLTNTDYVFDGWNTVANGTGTSYQPGTSITLNADETFYAQWTPLIQISFSSNGGVGSINPLSGQVNTGVTLPGSTSLTYAGFTLTSWNTAVNGSGTSYALGQAVTLSTSLTLYAQWTPVPNIVVNFSANGGNGSLADLSGPVGTTVTLPSSSSAVRTGFTLASWNTAANGSGTSYALGQAVTLSTSLTLYAQWSATPTSTLYGSIGVFRMNSSALTTSLKTQVERLAAIVKEKSYVVVRLFGYSADTGIASLNGSLSSARASRVASFLQSELRSMSVTGVKISASGEGAVSGRTSSRYSCVEVFVQ